MVIEKVKIEATDFFEGDLVNYIRIFGADPQDVADAFSDISAIWRSEGISLEYDPTIGIEDTPWFRITVRTGHLTDKQRAHAMERIHKDFVRFFGTSHISDN